MACGTQSELEIASSYAEVYITHLGSSCQHAFHIAVFLQQRRRRLWPNATHAWHIVRRIAAQRQHVRELRGQGFGESASAMNQGKLQGIPCQARLSALADESPHSASMSVNCKGEWFCESASA